MTLRGLTIISLLLLSVMVVIASTYERPPGRPFACKFKRVTGIYFTTERDLSDEGALIIVTGTDGRTHALNRSDIDYCEAKPNE